MTQRLATRIGPVPGTVDGTRVAFDLRPAEGVLCGVVRGSATARAFATFEVSVLAFAYAAEGMILRGLSQHRASGLIGMT